MTIQDMISALFPASHPVRKAFSVKELAAGADAAAVINERNGYVWALAEDAPTHETMILVKYLTRGQANFLSALWRGEEEEAREYFEAIKGLKYDLQQARADRENYSHRRPENRSSEVLAVIDEAIDLVSKL